MADATSLTAAALVASAYQAFATEAGKAGWAGLRHVIDLVRGKLSNDGRGQEALAEVETSPGDVDRVRQLADVLEMHLVNSPDFGRELAALISTAEADPVVGPMVTQVSGNARVGKLVVINTVNGDVSF
jgi:hypothetical protein